LAALARVLLLLAGALTATALLAATLLTAALTGLTGLLVLLAALARTIVRIVRHGRCTPVVQIPVQDNASVATSFRRHALASIQSECAARAPTDCGAMQSTRGVAAFRSRWNRHAVVHLLGGDHPHLG
jgi:hypothetical protein